jgi:hypothetical protein
MILNRFGETTYEIKNLYKIEANRETVHRERLTKCHVRKLNSDQPDSPTSQHIHPTTIHKHIQQHKHNQYHPNRNKQQHKRRHTYYNNSQLQLTNIAVSHKVVKIKSLNHYKQPNVNSNKRR